MANKPTPAAKPSARDKLLDAALVLIRTKGYSATSVDELCAEAGVTKGAFFHHFKSKEDLAIASTEYWSTVTNALFASAPYQRHEDPRQRVLGYLDFRKSILKGKVPEYTCLLGTMVQEAFATHPAIREACHRAIFGHSEAVAQDIEAAKKLYAPEAAWSSKGLALHFQAVLQGGFILAKSDENAALVAESIDHLRGYVESLFNKKEK